MSWVAAVWSWISRFMPKLEVTQILFQMDCC